MRLGANIFLKEETPNKWIKTEVNENIWQKSLGAGLQKEG